MASALGADPGLKGVSFGPLLFFAISHADVTPPREYTISAAGFWVQHASREWLLTRRPGLRHQRAPLAKGLLAFNVLASVAYATAAFGTFGPSERDTRAMADVGYSRAVGGSDDPRSGGARHLALRQTGIPLGRLDVASTEGGCGADRRSCRALVNHSVPLSLCD